MRSGMEIVLESEKYLEILNYFLYEPMFVFANIGPIFNVNFGLEQHNSTAELRPADSKGKQADTIDIVAFVFCSLPFKP